MGTWNQVVMAPYVPNMWERLFPAAASIVGQMFLQKMAQNYRTTEAETQRKALETQADIAAGEKRMEAGWTGAEVPEVGPVSPGGLQQQVGPKVDIQQGMRGKWWQRDVSRRPGAFTLGPEDIRFGPTGQEVAKGQAKLPSTDFERAYKQYLNVNSLTEATYPRSQFKQEKWSPPRRSITMVDPKTGQVVVTEGLTGKAVQGLITQKEQQDLKTSRIGAMTSVKRLSRLQALIGTDSSLLSMTGGTIRGIDSFYKQVKAASRMLSKGKAEVNGSIVKEDNLLNPNLYDFGTFAKSLETTAAKAAVIKGAMTRAAYIYVRTTLGERGMLSNRDIQLALESLGARTGSATQAQAMLEEAKWDMIDSYYTEHAATTGGYPEQDVFGVLPKGLPTGSRIIGKHNGNPVYSTPDGRRIEVQRE